MYVFGILSSFSAIIRNLVGAFPTLVVFGEGKGLGKSGATSAMLHGFSCNETRKFQESIDATHIRQAVNFFPNFVHFNKFDRRQCFTLFSQSLSMLIAIIEFRECQLPRPGMNGLRVLEFFRFFKKFFQNFVQNFSRCF